MNCFLIDFENVKSSGLKGIEFLNTTDDVYIFYSINAQSITFDIHHSINKSSANLTFTKSDVSGKNSLDFQLISYLGYLIAQKKYKNYFVITGDRGFESAVSFWKKFFRANKMSDLNIDRYNTIQDALVNKKSNKSIHNIKPQKPTMPTMESELELYQLKSNSTIIDRNTITLESTVHEDLSIPVPPKERVLPTNSTPTEDIAPNTNGNNKSERENNVVKEKEEVKVQSEHSTSKEAYKPTTKQSETTKPKSLFVNKNTTNSAKASNFKENREAKPLKTINNKSVNSNSKKQPQQASTTNKKNTNNNKKNKPNTATPSKSIFSNVDKKNNVLDSVVTATTTDSASTLSFGKIDINNNDAVVEKITHKKTAFKKVEPPKEDTVKNEAKPIIKKADTPKEDTVKNDTKPIVKKTDTPKEDTVKNDTKPIIKKTDTPKEDTVKNDTKPIIKKADTPKEDTVKNDTKPIIKKTDTPKEDTVKNDTKPIVKKTDTANTNNKSTAKNSNSTKKVGRPKTKKNNTVKPKDNQKFRGHIPQDRLDTMLNTISKMDAKNEIVQEDRVTICKIVAFSQEKREVYQALMSCFGKQKGMAIYHIIKSDFNKLKENG